MGRRHDHHKRALVEYLGGKCVRCGYSRDHRVLTFHHENGSSKEFGIGKKITSSLKRLKKEADKCVLLCLNCHAEKHLGLW